MERQFTRRIEDFTCEHCKAEINGNGFTNHCPKCLWSKHVDVHPGDRADACSGMMEPSSVELTSDEYSIVHRCIRCAYTKKNKTTKDDNFNLVIQLSKKS